MASAGEAGAPPAEVYQFTFPAHIAFEVTVFGGGVEAARREARRALASLDASDSPLGGVDGPLPGAPALVNLCVWAGSARQLGALELDALEIELAARVPAT